MFDDLSVSVALAVVLVCVGLGSAVFGLAAATVEGVRHRDPERITGAFPWGYMGAGLAVGVIGFAATSLVISSPLAWADVVEVAPVLLVNSAGYAALLEVVERRLDRAVPWTTPLALSLALGVILAIALRV